jgi:hypothetical protein
MLRTNLDLVLPKILLLVVLKVVLVRLWVAVVLLWAVEQVVLVR